MSAVDLLFLALVLGLPIIIAVRLFQNEPSGRPFLATYALAVLRSSILFGVAALALMLVGVNGLGPFDGLFGFIAAIPIALVVGVFMRRRRHSIL